MLHNHSLMRRLAATLLIMILTAAAITPGRALAGGPIGARGMLIAYYDLINARDYWTAYQQWEAPTQTYADFVAGYATTTFVSAYFGGFQARQPHSLEGRVPGVLIGYHADGSAVAYRGCYGVRYHPESTGIGQWTITEGTFTPMSYIPTDEALIYRDELDMGCIEHGSGIEAPADFMLMDYIDAVNRGDYDEAFGFWANPRQTYEGFVLGWSDTVETVLFYGYYQPSIYVSTYETGRIPVVMLGYHTDGSMVAYQGCLGVSYNATFPTHWGLYASYLYPLAVPPTSATIATSLNAVCY